jgi:nitrogen fixation/metabolism regulation signal transduction histidine kinase
VAAKKTFERKHFFIDRKFQGRYMLTFLIPMLIMLVFMLVTLATASRSLFSTTTRIIKDDIENVIATGLQDRSEPTVQDYQLVVDNISSYMREFSDSSKIRRALISSLMLVFGIGIFIVIIQTVVLTVYFSHRVAGPVYRFEKTCHELIEGNYQQKIQLRRGDELQNLANLLNMVIVKSRERLGALRDEPDEQRRKEISESLNI